MNKQIVALVVLMVSQAAFGGRFVEYVETEKTQADVCYDYINDADTKKAEGRINGGNIIMGCSAVTGALSLAGLYMNELAFENKNFQIFNASFNTVAQVLVSSLVLSVFGLIVAREFIRSGETIKWNLKHLKNRLANHAPEKLQEAREEDEQYEQKIKHDQENAALQNELLKLKVAKQKQSA